MTDAEDDELLAEELLDDELLDTPGSCGFVAQGSQHAVFVPLGHPTIAHRFNGGKDGE